MESILLWPVVFSVVGWTKYFRNRHPDHESAIWPILLIPLIVALWLSAFNGFDVYSRYLSRVGSSAPAPPSGYFLIDVWLPVMRVANPLLMWVAISVPLAAQARIWRQPVRLGVCPICNYDHQGNASGVCPECGSEVVRDPAIPRAYYHRRFWWTPELARFPDAKARHVAMKRAHKELQASPLGWAAFGVHLIGLICVMPGTSALLGRWRILVLALAVVPVFVFNLVLQPRAIRRSLRRQLAGLCDSNVTTS